MAIPMLPSSVLELLREITPWPDDDRALLFDLLAHEEPDVQLRLSRALKITGAMRSEAVVAAAQDAIEARFCADCGRGKTPGTEHECPEDDEDTDESDDEDEDDDEDDEGEDESGEDDEKKAQEQIRGK